MMRWNGAAAASTPSTFSSELFRHSIRAGGLPRHAKASPANPRWKSQRGSRGSESIVAACGVAGVGCHRSSAARRRALSESQSDGAGRAPDEPKAAPGLSSWRQAHTTDKEVKVPVILFGISDLLLPGRTKRMHLFEPRWARMIDAARKDYCGIFCMLYVDDSQIVPVASIVEIVACDDLGMHGRKVQVRSVGRGSLRGLTEQVTSPNQWGLALVEELPEAVLPQDLLDLDADASDGGRTAAVVAGRLSEVMANMDLGSEAAQKADGPEAKDSDSEEGPVMWTHEREEVAESLGQLTAAAWQQRLEDVTQTLRGVPVCTTPQSAEAAVCPSLAVAYAALSFLSLERRVDFFRNEDWDLTKRLEVLEKQMVEVQGMARARKALAGVFTDKSG